MLIFLLLWWLKEKSFNHFEMKKILERLINYRFRRWLKIWRGCFLFSADWSFYGKYILGQVINWDYFDWFGFDFRNKTKFNFSQSLNQFKWKENSTQLNSCKILYSVQLKFLSTSNNIQLVPVLSPNDWTIEQLQSDF